MRPDQIAEKQRGADKQLHAVDKRGYSQYGQLQLRDHVQPDGDVQQQDGRDDDQQQDDELDYDRN